MELTTNSTALTMIVTNESRTSYQIAEPVVIDPSTLSQATTLLQVDDPGYAHRSRVAHKSFEYACYMPEPAYLGCHIAEHGFAA